MNSRRLKARKYSFLRHVASSKDGLAVVEFGLMLPVLMTLFYASIELTRYVLVTQKVEKLAHTVSDVTAQSSTVTKTSLDQVMAAASDVMKPFDLNTNGRVIVSSLYKAAGAADATISWRYEGGGTLSEISKFGAVGAKPTMPVAFAFDDKENIIAAEVYYQFSPLLTNQFFGTTTVYRVAFYKPRLGALTSPPS